MNDQTQDTRNEEAPETPMPEKKAPLEKRFTPQGEERLVTLEPVSEGAPEKRITVQFGILETWRGDETPKKAGRFKVVYPVVIDGMQNDVEILSADAAKGIAQAIRTATNKALSADDFVVDLDDEFFDQKYTAPKVDKDNVWQNEEIDNETLAALSGEAEEVLESQSEAQRETQDQAFALADVLHRAFLAVGKSRKALQSWAMGKDGANFPHLRRLGKGSNALYEAMRFVELSDTQRNVLPETLTSGKALERHRSVSIEAMVGTVIGSGMEWPEGYETVKIGRYPDLEGMASIIRRVAEKEFGIKNAGDKDLTQLGEEAASAAAEAIGEFMVEYGKSVNTYQKDEYAAALFAYGAATLCDADSGSLMGNAIKGLQEIASNDLDEAAVGEALAKLIGGNLFLSKAVKEAWKHRTTLEKERENREILDEVDEDNGPISKKAAVSFAKLDALPAAAHLFKLLCTHPDSKEVLAELTSLARQHSNKLGQPDEG